MSARSIRCVAGAILVAVGIAGCSARPPAERWTAMTARAHREADRRLDAGDTAGARARLLALVDAQKAHARRQRRSAAWPCRTPTFAWRGSRSATTTRGRRSRSPTPG